MLFYFGFFGLLHVVALVADVRAGARVGMAATVASALLFLVGPGLLGATLASGDSLEGRSIAAALAGLSLAIAAVGLWASRALHRLGETMVPDRDGLDRVQSAALAHLGISVLALGMAIVAGFALILLSRP